MYLVILKGWQISGMRAKLGTEEIFDDTGKNYVFKYIFR